MLTMAFYKLHTVYYRATERARIKLIQEIESILIIWPKSTVFWIKKGDYSEMVVVYPYYGHMFTMAFYKLHTVYYTEKWATIKLIQEIERVFLIFH